MLLHINPKNPQERQLQQVVNVLKKGGVIIYPTDTSYGLGCDIRQKKAVERICRIKGILPQKALLTCVCENIKIIGTYANQVSTPVYKIMRLAMPGPYTFILKASKEVPRHFQPRKTVGIRVPDNLIPIRLTELLGNPIASISLPSDEDQPEFNMDPSLMYERYDGQVDLVIDGGYGGLGVSTIIDCSNGDEQIEILREGLGELGPIGLIAYSD
ncbi:UNVERIFIED_CONTAM: hypothetical protein GTU68_010992 [Idotea baltica]|nr:hypothetical protein [Idotea baltica]